MIKKGFTLIEILVAATIFAITMVFVTALASSCIKIVSSSVAAKANNDAIRILNNKIGQTVAEATHVSCLANKCTFTEYDNSQIDIQIGTCLDGRVGVCMGESGVVGANLLPSSVSTVNTPTLTWVSSLNNANTTGYLDVNIGIIVNAGEPTESEMAYITQLVSRRQEIMTNP